MLEINFFPASTCFRCIFFVKCAETAEVLFCSRFYFNFFSRFFYFCFIIPLLWDWRVVGFHCHPALQLRNAVSGFPSPSQANWVTPTFCQCRTTPALLVCACACVWLCVVLCVLCVVCFVVSVHVCVFPLSWLCFGFIPK